MNKLRHKHEKEMHFIVQWFDVLFVMVLCFVTLLGTMLLRGRVLVGAGSAQGLDYSLHLPLLVIVAVVFAVYLGYMLSHSNRELGEMVDHVYGPEDRAASDGDGEKETV